MLDRNDWWTLAKWVLILVTAYVGFAHVVYGLRHPEMTDMQRFVHTADALLFR